MDVDHIGQVVGASVEWFSEGDRVQITAMPPEPFETPPEAFGRVLALIPLQGTLFVL